MSSEPFPFVSVIVPVRNEESYVADCLRSLLNQDYPWDGFEIIVVDNDSSDRSADVIAQFSVRYVFEKKRGAAAARNAGVRQSKGELLAFIDSDCIAPPDWLSSLVLAFNRREVDAIGANAFTQKEHPFWTIFWPSSIPGGENPPCYMGNLPFY